MINNNMWDFLFKELVFRPQLNAMQYLFNFTKDIGYALIIVAVIFNILAFYWFTKSFLNMQKRLALGQEFRNIQHYFKEKNKLVQAKLVELAKDTEKNQTEITRLNEGLSKAIFDQQKFSKEINSRFNIAGNYSVKTAFLQLWVSIGLFTIFNVITRNESLEGLYPQLWNGQTLANFGSNVKAFGNIEISKNLMETGLLWVPALNALFSFFAMYYSFKHTIRPKVRPLTDFEQKQMDKIKLQNEQEGLPDMDPEKIAKQSQQFNLYLIPIITIVFNYNLSTGLNIYYCFLSILFFGRTYFADMYFRFHQQQYMAEVLESEPIFPYQDLLAELHNGNFDFASTPTEIMSKKPILKNTV